MAELKVYVSEELDKKFRMIAMSVYGFGRGSLSEAAVQALTDWCKQHETQSSFELKDVKSKLNSDPAARAEERPSPVGPEQAETSNTKVSTS